MVKFRSFWKRFTEIFTKYRSYIIISTILIIGAVIILIVLWLAALSYNSSTCKSTPTSILIPRDNIASLKANQTAGQSLPWCYSDLPKQRITHFASIPTGENGNFTYDSMSNQNIGKYNITIYPINESQAKYSIPIEVVNPFFTLTAYLLYAGIIFFGLLMVATIIPSKKEAREVLNYNLTSYKIWRFIFISGMVISILGGLALTDVEVGSNSPIGLILQHGEWVINIGGNTISNDRLFTISIPFYVVLLGLAGGYLRYLSKAASKQYIHPPEYIKPENNSQEFAVGTEAELSEIGLAPLLATVVWLLLSQGQTTPANIYWLAAVSFSVGLVTREIIDGIKRLMTRLSLNATKQFSSREE
jgi:hypothetical protein